MNLSRSLLVSLVMAYPTVSGEVPDARTDAVTSVKPRVIVETDIGGDPDDRSSLVRLLHHLCDLEVVGILTTRPSGDKRLPDGFLTGKDVAKYHIDRYGEVVENLRVHRPDYPSYHSVLSILKDGQISSRAGVDLVKREILREDARPLMFTNWGDDIGEASDSSLNRALNEIGRENSKSNYEKLASRVHYVGAGWQKHIFDHRESVGRYVDTFNPKWEAQGGNWYARWKPVTMDKFPTGVERDIVSGHNVLSASYHHGQNPNFQKEGDTLTYMQFLVNGLNVPGKPWLGGWSGRFQLCGGEGSNVACPGSYPRGVWWWNDSLDAWKGSVSRDNTLARWASHLQNDFAARADWASTSNYHSANHHPIVHLNGNQGFDQLRMRARSGENLRLDASETVDPDGDQLKFEWMIYSEISAPGGEISSDLPAVASFKVPADAAVGHLFQIILIVTDDGKGLNGDQNFLTSYKRVTVEVVR